MNHYETLELATDATQEEVTLAYRRKAAQHHPDKGGDKDEFQRVEAAGACLRDPERRAQYDATGNDGRGPAGPPKEQRIYSMIVQAWMTAADPLDRPGKQIAAVLKDLAQGRRELEKKEPELRSRLEKLETRFGLVESGSENNAYEDALRGHIAAINSQLTQLADTREVMTVMQDMVKAYKLTEAGRLLDEDMERQENLAKSAQIRHSDLDYLMQQMLGRGFR